MQTKLRIVFTILSAVCLAIAIPLGMIFDLVGLVSSLLGAGLFFMLMLICKQNQEIADKKAEKRAKAQQDGETNSETDDEMDDEMETTPQKPLSKTAVTKPPRYRRKK